MGNPTLVIQKTAESYARVLGDEWEDLTPERQERFRVLSFHIYQMHVSNKLQGMKQAIEAVEDVQCAPSTPKRWLPGVQEAKNALCFMVEEEMEILEMRVEVPDVVPDNLDAEDPYSTLTAGDKSPYGLIKSEDLCGVVKSDDGENGWTCTRLHHPSHWQHWDNDPGEWYEDADGEILVTWFDGGPLETVHPAVKEYEDGE